MSASEEGDETVLWHFNNVAANYDALLELFSKQTHSPGIKACYDLHAIQQTGTFVIRSSTSDSEVLTLEIANPQSGQLRCEPLEFMLDIRNHVLLTEIPHEIEQELAINALSEAFVPQLRSLCDIKAVVIALNESGHCDFQVGYEKRLSFELDGLQTLEATHRQLGQELEQFHNVVHRMRAEFVFLNWFTMREILHISELYQRWEASGGSDQAQQNVLVEMASLMHLVSSSVHHQAVAQGISQISLYAEAPDQTLSKMETLLTTVGSILSVIFTDKPTVTREVPVPGDEAVNRSDMLVTAGDNQQPIFVTCTDMPIDVVLSLYVRRGRLPEPSEILFCSSSSGAEGSIVEDIQLLIWRFFLARRSGGGDSVMCVAEIQLLSYAQQCTIMEHINQMIETFGVKDTASALLFLSSQPRQLLLNALSAGNVELPPLDSLALSAAVSYACETHLGTTMVVRSELEGGGKTHWIRKWVAEQQSLGNFVLYRKIPMREESTAASLQCTLRNFSTDMPNAFHLVCLILVAYFSYGTPNWCDRCRISVTFCQATRTACCSTCCLLAVCETGIT